MKPVVVGWKVWLNHLSAEYRNASRTPALYTLPTIIDDVTVTDPSPDQVRNSCFEEALRKANHPALKHYQSLTGREQTRWRRRLHKRTSPKRPGFEKRQQLWESYESELKLYEVTRKLEER